MAKLTTEDFIRKARLVHGEKYDYSKAEYNGDRNKIIIICPKHGEFLQSPYNHLEGKGCPKCVGRGLTKEDFIKEAKTIHGEKYDYSKVVYGKSTDKVIIICPEHGEFEIQPTIHLNNKRGCTKCTGHYMDEKYFKEKASKLHNNKYDYSKVIYKHNAKKIIIICREHGEFSQTPNSHFNGAGCPTCGTILQADGKRFTTKEFIIEAKAIHGNKYDYSKVNYIGMHDKITIICPEHGEFKQEPSSHLHNGSGCSKCGDILRGLSRRNTQDEFIEKAKAIHGDKYDYSKVNYVTVHDKITIICREHGEFLQDPSNHLVGAQCPKCSHRSFKYSQEEFLDKIKAIHGNKYDYSKVNYVDCKTKIIIICREHGEWLQSPESHLNGNGCPKCMGRNKTTDEFIIEAKTIHGNRYDYSKLNYVNSENKVIIICREHGEFLQNPCDHLGGKGCSKCNGHGFKWLMLDEVKKIIQSHNIKTQREYYEWWDKN
jgi:hypothetical protein